jgi:hypothetical protein
MEQHMKKQVSAPHGISGNTLDTSTLELVAGGAPSVRSNSSNSSNGSNGSNGTPKDQPSAPPGIGAQPGQKTSETVKQAVIFGTAFTGLGIAGNSMFGPEQQQQSGPPPGGSGEPLDYL